MNNTMYIVRGTGYMIDGSIVVIQDEGSDGYVSVRPHTLDDNVELPIKLHKKFLQPLGERNEFNYTFLITKSNEKNDIVGETSVAFNKSLRDVNIHSIADFIIANLNPILTME
jgi:hypothetical protein